MHLIIQSQNGIKAAIVLLNLLIFPEKVELMHGRSVLYILVPERSLSFLILSLCS